MTEVMVITANVFYLFAMLARDVLKLRMLIFCSSSIWIGWGIIKDEWLFTAWLVLFICINSTKIVQLLRERMHIELPPELQSIYSEIFSSLSRREFLNFWNFGLEQRYAAGDMVIQEQSKPDHVLFLIEGTACVDQKGTEVAKLNQGCFAGEMSFLTNRPAVANVVADDGLRVMQWSQAKLHDLGQINPPLIAKLNRILACDLTAKVAASARYNVPDRAAA